jgi:uncharacterized membrane protein
MPELTCPACRIIDKADGLEDGNLFATYSHRVGHHQTIVDSLSRASDRLADAVTKFAGSMSFVAIHSAWFVGWILVNVGLLGAALVFDKFPFGLLTMIVSLEAIFLSTFVMIAQNRQAARADARSQVDFEDNLRSEIWGVHIGQALGIDSSHVEKVVREAIDDARKAFLEGPPKAVDSATNAR